MILLSNGGDNIQRGKAASDAVAAPDAVGECAKESQQK